MYLIKPLILSGLYHLKFFDILRYIQKNRVIILMYHRFSEKPEPFKIQQSVFENQIKFLTKRYKFISLNQYSEVLNGERSGHRKNAIVLTIDDGYQDNYTFAYPVLKKYSLPATIFITTDFVSRRVWLWPDKLAYILKNSRDKEFEFPLNGRIVQFQVDNFNNWHRTQLAIFNHCRTISDDNKNEFLIELAKHLKVDVPEQTAGGFQPLTWDQIRQMHDNGIDFGSHTCSHPILSQLTQKQMEYEIAGSKKEIEERIHRQISLFSYPNGQEPDFNDEVIKILKKTKYKCAVTTIYGYNKYENQDPFCLRRVSMGNIDRTLEIYQRLT